VRILSMNTCGTHVRKFFCILWIGIFFNELSAQSREGESALYFPAGVTEASLPPSSALNLTDALTIEAWIKPDGWGEGPNYLGTIFQKTSIWLFIIQHHSSANDSSLILQLRHPGGVSHSYTEAGSIVLNEWSHIAVSYDGNQSEMSMWINGKPQEVGHISMPSGPVRNNAGESMRIGSVASGIMGFMGVLDDVRIWNLVRTDSEIRQSMGAVLDGQEPGLQAYWPMNEGGGNQIFDLSPSGHDIVVSGVEWTYGTPFSPTTIWSSPRSGQFTSPTFEVFPNPFNSSVTIRSTRVGSGDLQIFIHNALGQRVWMVHSATSGTGTVTGQWSGTDALGQTLPGGVYFITLQSGDQLQTQPVLLVK